MLDGFFVVTVVVEDDKREDSLVTIFVEVKTIQHIKSPVFPGISHL